VIITDLAGIIAAVGSVITALGVILVGYWAYKGKNRADDAKRASENNNARIVELDGKLYTLGVNVDGRLSELLRVSTEAARAQGVAEGEQAQRDRQAPSDRSGEKPMTPSGSE